jgi:hypothetical protein
MKWTSAGLAAIMIFSFTAYGLQLDDFAAFDETFSNMEELMVKFGPPNSPDEATLPKLDGGISMFLDEFSMTIDQVDLARKTRALALVERVFTTRFGLKSPSSALNFLARHAPARARELAAEAIRDHDSSIAATSARILLESGQWDIAAPILDSLGDFRSLASTNDPRAVPLLRRAAESDSNLERSLSAASYLGYVFNDWEVALTTARRHASQDKLVLPDRARIMVVEILRKGVSAEDAFAAARFAEDSNLVISNLSFEALADMARRQVPGARAALQELATSGSEDRVRPLAARILRNLDKPKEER